MRMRLGWVTDVHLDSVGRATFENFCSEILAAEFSALLLSGDIADANSVSRWLRILQSELSIPIYFVLGNHDFYGGSIASIRQEVRELESESLTYLTAGASVQLTADVALVGHDGWGDCRIGAINEFEMLSDYLAIEDLSALMDIPALRRGSIERAPLREKLKQLGDEASAELGPVLRAASQSNRATLVLTHIPPFREACWHDGSISAPTWLPGFTCNALGDLLEEVAREAPHCNFVGLCGHTHGYGYAELAPNLSVHTGYGSYGELHIGMVEILDSHLHIQPPQPATTHRGA